ncbi:hypothetical protein EMCRGX_G016076 [Ephydatia muelleri]
MRVDRLAIVVPTCHRAVAMARSTTTYLHKLEGYPVPEQPDEPLMDRYYSSEDSEVSTPTPRGANKHQYSWSDDTLAGSLTGRSSVDSWAGEYELDRIATERVTRMFNNISKALYDGRGTGQAQVDGECREWSAKFPHFLVQGEHLLDSYDDGTEIISSTCVSTRRDPENHQGLRKDFLSSASGVGFNSITIAGRKIQPFTIATLPDTRDTSDLYEEIIATDGVIEESFAFDNTDEDPFKKKRQSKLKHHSRLPPVTPIACVQEAVRALVFDQLWEEVVGALQPLLAAIEGKLRAEYGGGFSHTSSHSSALNQAILLANPYHPNSYVLRPSEHSRFQLADEQSNYQMMLKRMPLVPLPTLPLHNLPSSNPTQKGLEGVMKIKSVPLQQRPAVPFESMDTGLGPTDSIVAYSRLGKNTPVVQRNPEPTSRLISGGRPPPGGKKNIMLKPLDKPRTPALAPIDDGIRGHRLHTSSTVIHSPPIPHLRNTQLPPLDMAEQSSPPVRRASAQRGGKVTFSRGLGTADMGGESWHLPKTLAGGSGAELRPNTTNASRDPNGRLLQRKNSDQALHFPAVVMKVVGHATGLTGVGGAFAGGMANTIVEDEEEGDRVGGGGGGVSNSSYVQPKPKSSRGKVRGHVR